MKKTSEEWSLNRGVAETDGQQAGEVPFKGECLLDGGNGPGWKQSSTPGSSKGRSGRKIGVKMNVNGYGDSIALSPSEPG